PTLANKLRKPRQSLASLVSAVWYNSALGPCGHLMIFLESKGWYFLGRRGRSPPRRGAGAPARRDRRGRSPASRAREEPDTPRLPRDGGRGAAPAVPPVRPAGPPRRGSPCPAPAGPAPSQGR